MTKTENLLLNLLARGLFCSERSFTPESADWAALFQEAAHHTVIPLVYDSLTPAERACIPAELSPQWQRTVITTLWQNEQIAAEQRRILSLFPFPCVILKGSSSAMNYPKPELRCAGDIDLLLSPEHIEAAQTILSAQGYALSNPENDGEGHLAMHRGPYIVELHRAPSGIPKSHTGDEIRAYFRNAERSACLRDVLPVLPPDRRAVLLLVHKLDHVLTSGLGLRQLCDWAVFVSRELSPALWTELTPTLKRFGLYRFGLIVTRTCVDYLGLPLDACPWCTDAPAELSAALMEDLLRSGNFGRKENRYGQRLFTDAQSATPSASFFRTSLQVCREKWPVCQKYPILLPAAPSVLLWRYFCQRRQGKRPAFHPAGVYRGAAVRQNLFKNLQGFIPEE